MITDQNLGKVAKLWGERCQLVKRRIDTNTMDKEQGTSHAEFARARLQGEIDAVTVEMRRLGARL